LKGGAEIKRKTKREGEEIKTIPSPRGIKRELMKLCTQDWGL